MPLDSEEQSLRFGERQSKFRGSAKIKLKHLQFDSSAFVDPKNVTRLTQIFELEGCHRLDVEHHVPAIIKEHLLQSSVALSNITAPDLMKNRVPPDLRLPTEVKLECLHGKHRIAAAQKFLYLPGDKWWTVDLYSDRRLPYKGSPILIKSQTNLQVSANPYVGISERTTPTLGTSAMVIFSGR